MNRRQDPIKQPRHGRRGGVYHWHEYHIQDYLPPSNLAPQVLLLGCGDGGERFHLEKLGFETIAFDLRRSPKTDFLADAHSLPLLDESFDLVLSMQVLEHLHDPWLATQEIARVLRPGGWFVGSVAFLKPYHKSYFHMTHLGVITLLRSSGLTVDRVTGAQSLSYSMYGTLFPLINRSICRALYVWFDRFLFAVRARLWSMRTDLKPDEPSDRFGEDPTLSFAAYDKLRFAPAVVFRARKGSVLV